AAAAEEASLVDGIDIYPVESLDVAFRFLSGEANVTPLRNSSSSFRRAGANGNGNGTGIDFSEIKGQHGVRRAVEVAVAGGHNLLTIGPPGSGKSMIAKRIPTIIPEPSLDEYLEILRIHSAAGRTISGEMHAFERPYRSPHHTIS